MRLFIGRPAKTHPLAQASPSIKSRACERCRIDCLDEVTLAPIGGCGSVTSRITCRRTFLDLSMKNARYAGRASSRRGRTRKHARRDVVKRPIGSAIRNANSPRPSARPTYGRHHNGCTTSSTWNSISRLMFAPRLKRQMRAVLYQERKRSCADVDRNMLA